MTYHTEVKEFERSRQPCQPARKMGAHRIRAGAWRPGSTDGSHLSPRPFGSWLVLSHSDGVHNSRRSCPHPRRVVLSRMVVASHRPQNPKFLEERKPSTIEAPILWADGDKSLCDDTFQWFPPTDT